MSLNMSEEDKIKFENELYWCLDQLKTSRSSAKLSPKQGKRNPSDFI